MSKENNVITPEKVQIDLPEVEQELSKVASNPKQNMLILIGIAGVFIYLFFNMFLSSNDSTKPADTPIPDNVIKPIQISSDSAIPAIPNLPPPPKLEDPTIPPPPPPTPALDVVQPSPLSPEAVSLPSDANDPAPVISSPTLPMDIKSQSDEAKRRLDAKRKSSIVLIAGVPSPKTPDQVEQEADFKFRGDMHLVLGRGKMLDAIIESAINTDFGGEIRAVISRDVYSEWGRNVLIPKGSRVFGSYVTGINGAYGRVAIEWTRIDLPTGYTINFGGTGMDGLGRKGQQGRVDNKFKERFGNAILRSAFNIALAGALDSLVKPVKTNQSAATQTAAATGAVTSASAIYTQAGISDAQKFAQICASVPAAIVDKTSAIYTAINTACTTIPVQQAAANPLQKLTALMSAITLAPTTTAQASAISTQPSQAQAASTKAFTDISDVAKELLDKQKFDPTITIDQGTPIKIYVNKDYKFPKAVIKKVMK